MAIAITHEDHIDRVRHVQVLGGDALFEVVSDGTSRRLFGQLPCGIKVGSQFNLLVSIRH